jgi:hypothetical protein
LYEAFEYADQTSGDVWEFAVEIDQLAALGLTRNDFRWLVRKGWVEHQREVTLEGDNGRAFRATGDLTFPDGTCFVLTDKGVSLARELGHLAKSAHAAPSLSANESGDHEEDQAEDDRGPSTDGGFRESAPSLPTWDAERRVLSINERTVKHFKWAAPNQEAILAAFQEEGWPARIDDPLRPLPEQDPKRRLSDTIKCLNRKQKNQLIHFCGDGTGEGVIWEFVQPVGPDDAQPR